MKSPQSRYPELSGLTWVDYYLYRCPYTGLTTPAFLDRYGKWWTSPAWGGSRVRTGRLWYRYEGAIYPELWYDTDELYYAREKVRKFLFDMLSSGGQPVLTTGIDLPVVVADPGRDGLSHQRWRRAADELIGRLMTPTRGCSHEALEARAADLHRQALMDAVRRAKRRGEYMR